MVAQKNVLATTMQILTITCIITILWLICGYSLAFGPASSTMHAPSSPIFGDGSRLWLRGMNVNSVHQLAPTIPEALYCAYQLTFAIITPALICGSFAERMKYESMIVFMVIWHILVYCPIAHSMWHQNGLFFILGSLDFAGGNVVHIASGTSGLVTAWVIGNRRGWKAKEESHPPHNILMTFMGMAMLWVGWLGFNAGSAVSAGPRAAFALLTTQISTATAAVSWLLVEWAIVKKPKVLGMVSGAVGGLVCITPAAGYVDMNGAFFIGLFGGVICYFGAQLKKHVLHIDDSLDAFGVHAIGGIAGGIMTGFFSTSTVSGLPSCNGVYFAGLTQGGTQLGKQLAAIVFSIGWSSIVTYLILKVVDVTMGLRVSEADEDDGLDASVHDETIHSVSGPRGASACLNSSIHGDLEFSGLGMGGVEGVPAGVVGDGR